MKLRPFGPRPVTAADADGLAIAALAFLAADGERLVRFLALSGLEPGTLRDAARTPGFLPAVLDHVAGDERLLLAFAAAQGCDPERVGLARAAYRGDEGP